MARKKPEATQPSDPQPMDEAASVKRHVLNWKDRPDVSGLSSGAATFNLLNQVTMGMYYGTNPAKEILEWKQYAAVATMRAMAPQDAIEGQLIAQMVATHEAAMDCYRRAAIEGQTFEGRQTALNLANKLLRTYAVLTDTLNKHRGKGQQTVRVEHVTVEAGGQAIVGNVTTGGGGEGRIGHQPHATLADAGLPPLRREDAERVGVPSASSQT
ncbi:hypothetical protein [Geminicoccus flavidas]|uniref:hypothetical protein n=1 Tax=Geminicoccus flavidas TaxID=2506407 RepID=UPI0013596DBE|nr:hypothetical protein [Geminicoccus flavidas]